MKTLLSKVQASDVITEPFPHIIVKDALEEDIYLKLVTEFPSIATLNKGVDNKGKDLSSNKRLHYLAKESLIDAQITPLWKEFLALHTSSTFLQEFLHIFKEPILQMYPDFEKKYGSFKTVRAGLRKVDTFETADVLLDALISINTPVVTKPTAVRRAHIDLPDKLFAGLFYMREPQDISTGGDLEIYKFKNGKPYGFRKCESAARYVEYVKTIKYERNLFVLFINSINSLHGVTVRSLTNCPRYFVNLVGEVKKPLFDTSPYQELPHMKYLRNLEDVMKKVPLVRS
jgi:hypothetical protein